MIDPIHSLAFSVQGNPKVYAVLLGSCVSRGASIPTGWEITLDLIRKIAALYQESCDPDALFGWNVEECANSVRILKKVRPRWIWLQDCVMGRHQVWPW